mmetsp:Transcript_28153/g.21051  ORF Transcript_28153/g.21051 Transcript_28153/m.21051 type:complete len:204 (+) Transcript_28153:331-942(+)
MVLTAGLLAINFCMLSSSIYHTFNSVSSYMHELLLRIDLVGICLMIFTLAILMTFTGFHNYHLLSICFASVMLITMITILLLQSFACLAHKFEKVRILFYQIFLALMLLLALSWAFIFSTNTEISLFFVELLKGFGALFIGFAFYASHIPEFLTKNYYVQMFSPSHMWWHIFVFVCGYKMYWLLFAAVLHIESVGDGVEPGLN